MGYINRLLVNYLTARPESIDFLSVKRDIFFYFLLIQFVFMTRDSEVSATT